MELAKQVCSLDLAKRLKELGVKQESYFFWIEAKVHGEEISSGVRVGPWNTSYDHDTGDGQWFKYYAAFTVTELGEMLPQYYFTRKHFGSGTKQWHWQVYSTTEEDMINAEIVVPEMHTSDTEADARAKMLIYLIENKLLTV